MPAFPLLDAMPYVEWPDDSGALQRLYPDTEESEGISLTAEVSKHPIEDGANIADHYRPDEDSVSVDFFFSNSPLRGDLGGISGSYTETTLQYPAPPATPFTPNGAINALSALISPNPLPQSIRSFRFDGPPNRGAEALAACLEIRNNARICTVSTRNALLTDMMLTGAALTKGKDEGDGSRLSMTFERVRFVQSEVALAVPVEQRALPKKVAGSVGAGETKEITDKDKASLLKQLLNNAGALTPGSGL